MRENKYRGKSIYTGKWVYGLYQRLVIHGIMKHFILPANSLMFDDIKLIDCLIEVIPETVGQYWRTINGIYLYDGDIFSLSGQYEKVVKLIQYNEEMACFCIANIDSLKYEYCMYIWETPSLDWWQTFNQDIKLLGNRFDDAHLLEE